MIRIYLDWNIFSYLKNKKLTEEPYKAIYSIIKRSGSKLIFPYSSAHLRDLKRGFLKLKDEIKREYTYQDLEFLSEISGNHLLSIDSAKTKNVIPKIAHPRVYFDDMLKNEEPELTFDELFSKADEADNPISLLQDMPIPIDFNVINEISDKYGNWKKAFANSKESPTMYNLIKDIMDMTSHPEKMAAMYKEARDSSLESMKMNGKPKEGEDAFEFVNKGLAKAKIKTSVKEMIDNSIKSSKDGDITKFDYFVKYYLSLDVHGYFSDDELPNLIDDAFHAFCGVHCDYYVTKDKNAYEKTKAVYKELNIETIVIKPEDFVQEFYKISDLSQSENEVRISRRISEAIKHSMLLRKSVDENLNPVEVYKVQFLIADFFNRMQISHNKNETIVFFYRRRVNYSDFMFWTEMQTLVNKIVREYGVDDKLRCEFTEKDKEESNSDRWVIRKWIIENITIELIYNQAPFSMCLQLSIPN